MMATKGAPVTIEMESASPSVFAVKSQCKKTLKPGKSCKVSVTFKPVDHTTAETGSLKIFDNASGAPQSVGLSGTGKPPRRNRLLFPSPFEERRVTAPDAKSVLRDSSLQAAFAQNDT